MRRLRAFAAVEIPPAVKKKLRRVRERIGALRGKVRLVEEENMHLTVKFLGDVDERDMYRACEIVRDAATAVDEAVFQVRRVGVFPSERKPRVFWAGVEEEGEAVLRTLHRRLDKDLGVLGVREENRAWHPHLTLARARFLEDPGETRELLEEMRDREFGGVLGSEICLFQSDLRRGGPVYAKLGTFPLGTGEGESDF